MPTFIITRVKQTDVELSGDEYETYLEYKERGQEVEFFEEYDYFSYAETVESIVEEL